MLKQLGGHIDQGDAAFMEYAYLVYERILSRLRMVLNLLTSTIHLRAVSDGAVGTDGEKLNHERSDREIEHVLAYAAPDLKIADGPRNTMKSLIEKTHARVRDCYDKYIVD